jgi:DHA2 family multidrug resistance protein
MTFRQFGASLGVALLSILIEERETLHSSRLFQHLQEAGGITAAWLAHSAAGAAARAGAAPSQAAEMAKGLLQQAGKQQAETLANADAFLFMASIGLVTLCLIPIIPPTPPAKK